MKSRIEQLEQELKYLRRGVEFPPIEVITKSHMSTREAAHYLNRREQTLHIWQCKDTGPIRAVKVNGRLAWPVVEIKRLLGAEQ